MLTKRTITILALAAACSLGSSALAQVSQPIPPGSEPPSGFYSYAVKFVCGFQSSQVGISLTPDGGLIRAGEPTVKFGNYATDINIFNPAKATLVEKKVLVLYDGDQDEFPPVGREPRSVGPSGHDEIELNSCSATMDDCIRIQQILNRPPSTSPLIGFLVLQSKQPLDVTAVYTAELCSDMSVPGATGCTTLPGIPGISAYGGGLSIDVEQVEGKYIVQ